MSLLDLSKLESGTMSLRAGAGRDRRSCSPRSSRPLAPTARKKGVDARASTSDGALAASSRGDAERLRQVFINLVDNAVKFTPTGGTVHARRARRATRRRRRRTKTASALLAPLAPRGRGARRRHRDRHPAEPSASAVFDAFYQVDSSSTREYGGTGLGLSIVKRLVDAHGGKVFVGANEPTGAVFSVVLPLAPREARVRTPRDSALDFTLGIAAVWCG